MFVVWMILIFLNTNTCTMQSIEPFSQEEFDDYKWQMPLGSETWNGYWPVWELEQDHTTQRLAISSQKVKEYVLNEMYKKKEPLKKITIEDQYKIACCIAAGAQRSVDFYLSVAIELNSLGFAATLAQFGANPNRFMQELFTQHIEEFDREGFNFIKERWNEVFLRLPLFFLAASRKMARQLHAMGADYSLRSLSDNSTVIHHVCTYLANYIVPDRAAHETSKLLDFYVKRGVDPFAIDNQSQTALHRVGLNLALYDINVALPLALRLYDAGIATRAHNMLDIYGKNFLDYVAPHRFYPSRGGHTRHMLFKYMQPLVDDDVFITEQVKAAVDAPQVRDPLYEPRRVDVKKYCDCTYSKRDVLEECDVFSLGQIIKECKDWVPQVPCSVLDCDALRNDSAYASWWHLMAILGTLDLFKKKSLLDKEQEHQLNSILSNCYPNSAERLLLDWPLQRTFFALCTICKTPGFRNEPEKIALLEDDVQLVQHALHHRESCDDKHNALTVAMATMINEYEPVSETAYFGTPFHYLAQHGMLCEKELAAYYRSIGIPPHSTNNYSQTPLDLLAKYGYRFYATGYCGSVALEKLSVLLHAMDVTKEACERVNPETNESPLSMARKTHTLWQLPCTKLVLDWFEKQVALDR